MARLAMKMLPDNGFFKVLDEPDDRSNWFNVPQCCCTSTTEIESDVVLGQTSQSVSYRPKYDACRNLGVGLEMVTALPLVVYTHIMCIKVPTKS